MRFLETLASWIVPLILLLAALLMSRGKSQTADSFSAGAREGLRCAVELLPTLVLLLTSVYMLSASGATAWLTARLAPIMGRLGVPSQLVGLLLTRPVSGSASTAMFARLMDEWGPDSFASLCAAVIMGSSDTVLYVLGVYFGAVGLKKTRYALPVALLGMLFNIFFACLLCRLFFAD